MAKTAFSLAEVLITLTIIGVIAALTIPNLITKHDKEQTVIRLRKAYNILQEATKLSVNENGTTTEWDLSLSEQDFAEKYYAPYLKLGPKWTGGALSYKTLKAGTYHNNGNFFLVLSDGMLLRIRPMSSNQSVLLIIDINGKKGPNKTGRDLFGFTICTQTRPNVVNTYTQYCNQPLSNRAGTLFAGTSGQCNPNAAGGWLNVGSYCSRLIELDNWQIKDDYPW